MRREDVIREIMSMRGVGYQVAKSIVLLAGDPEGTVKKIGTRRVDRQPMTQSQALLIVAAATMRIELVDSGD